LSFVGMIGTGVNFQLFQLAAAKTILGKHPSDSDRRSRPFSLNFPKVFGPQYTRVVI
jgi:hypothetical protein